MNTLSVETALMPHLVVKDGAEAAAFYEKAFGAEIVIIVPLPDGGGTMHAEVSIDGHTVMLAESAPEMGMLSPEDLGGTPVTLHLRVADADAVFRRAEDAGCGVTMPLTEMFWGDIYGRLVDPFGHNWSVSERVKEMTPEEIAEAAKTAFDPPPD